MTIQDVINKIIAYHPALGEREAGTCDTIKIGDPSAECTGVATAIYPSPDVIRKAKAAGCNLIVVHEPSFYSHMDQLDWLEGNSVFEAKKKLLLENGMVVFRDHDRIHAHIPDGIFYGVLAELGWLPYLKTSLDKPGNPADTFIAIAELPDVPVKEVAETLKEKLQLKSLRIIGNKNTIVRKAALGAHLLPGSQKAIRELDENNIDLYIPLEVIDWEVLPYFKDAGQLGLNKACLQTGHFNGEELGMKYAVGWLRELVEDKVPVVYCCNEDMYDYI